MMEVRVHRMDDGALQDGAIRAVVSQQGLGQACQKWKGWPGTGQHDWSPEKVAQGPTTRVQPQVEAAQARQVPGPEPRLQVQEQ